MRSYDSKNGKPLDPIEICAYNEKPKLHKAIRNAIYIYLLDFIIYHYIKYIYIDIYIV